MKQRSDPCARAQKLYERGDLKSSLKQLEKCSKMLTQNLRESDNKESIRIQLAKVYNFTGLIALQLRNMGTAESNFGKAENILSKVASSKEIDDLRGEIFYSRGLIALFKNMDPNHMFISSEMHFVNAQNYESAIKVLFQLHDYVNDPDEKFEYLTKIQKLSRKVKHKKNGKLLEARSRLEEGKLQAQLKDPKSKNTILKAQKLYSKVKSEFGMAQVLIELANIEEPNDSEKAEEYLMEALDLAKIVDSKKLIGSVYTHLGIIYLKRGSFKKGKTKLLEGLKYRTESGDKDGSAQTLLELARISLISAKDEKDLSNAVQFVSQATDLYNETSNEIGLAMAEELASTLYIRLNNYEMAVSSAKTARKIFQKYKFKEAEARILAQLGVALDGTGSTEEVIPVLEKAEKLFKDINSVSGVAEVNYFMGMHYQSFDSDKALHCLKSSLELYESLAEDNKQMEMMCSMVKKKIDEVS
ncbi:MAG: hypothetical protein INQ03_13045 [Candidatus Heimdallarchaeota archaeon]|nr:hypothetical protein [Candidatus Heimdallarchaeota archaeon]